IPITLRGLPHQVTVSPTGCFRFIYFTAASFSINAELSVRKSFEKLRPSFICQPMVFPKSRDAVTTPKSVERFGSLAGQLNPLVLFHMPVVGLSDSAKEVTAPVCKSSSFTASKCECMDESPVETVMRLAREYPTGLFFANCICR